MSKRIRPLDIFNPAEVPASEPTPPPGNERKINPSISDAEWEARQEVEARFLHGYRRRFGNVSPQESLRGTVAEAAFIASFQVSEVVRTLNKWAAEDK